tara:strand:- start:20068 stop:20397 length:330 start_codon:yes stop_codon:yes gene_type:complete
MKTADARIDLRLSPEIKALAQRASSLAGTGTLSEFVIQAVREKSLRIMTEMQTITLENNAFDSFWAACEQACPPNQALRAAQARHQQRIEHGEISYRASAENTPQQDSV